MNTGKYDYMIRPKHENINSKINYCVKNGKWISFAGSYQEAITIKVNKRRMVHGRIVYIPFCTIEGKRCNLYYRCK